MYQIIEAVDAVFAAAQFNPSEVIANSGRLRKIDLGPIDIAILDQDDELDEERNY